MTIHLKAPDQATFDQAIVDAGWTTEVVIHPENPEANTQPTTVTEVQAYTATHSLDVIGTIYVETGNMITVEATEDTEEYQYAETEAIEGWHANLLLHGEDMPDELSGFVIEAPATPYRKFA
jgi:hypothetical protein